MIFRLLILLGISVFLSSCIKLEVKEVVSDTVNTGKDIYNSARMKSRDEEVQRFEHTLVYGLSEVDVDDVVAVNTCLSHLKELVELRYQFIRFKNQKSEITVKDEQRFIHCEAYIVYKASKAKE